MADLVPLYPWLPAALALPLHDVNFSTRITDGSNGERHTSGLSLQTGAADLTSAVQGLVLRSAMLSAPGPGQQMQLTIDGLFQGAPLRLSATSTQPDTVAGGLPIPITVTGQAASASLAVRGTVPASWNGLGYDLQVNVHAPNLADLSPLARRPLPDVRDIIVDAHVGDAGFRLRGFNLRELTVNSSLGDLAGNVTVAWSPVPTLSGTLNAKHLDVDGVLAAMATLNTNAAAQAVTAEASPVAIPAPDAPVRVFSDAKLPFGVVHDADADLTLTAARLTLGGETYRDLQAHLFANGGKLVLNPARVTAPGGVMIGALTLDAGIDPSPVALTLRAPSMSASRVAALLGFAGGASGQMQVDAQLSGVGDSAHALAASANGHVGLAMVNGQVHRGAVPESGGLSPDHRRRAADRGKCRCALPGAAGAHQAGAGERGSAGGRYVSFVADRDWHVRSGRGNGGRCTSSRCCGWEGPGCLAGVADRRVREPEGGGGCGDAGRAVRADDRRAGAR